MGRREDCGGGEWREVKRKEREKKGKRKEKGGIADECVGHV
jgi:hypothetical protein